MLELLESDRRSVPCARLRAFYLFDLSSVVVPSRQLDASFVRDTSPEPGDDDNATHTGHRGAGPLQLTSWGSYKVDLIPATGKSVLILSI